MAAFYIRNLFADYGIGLTGLFSTINTSNNQQVCSEFWRTANASFQYFNKIKNSFNPDLNYHSILSQSLWGNIHFVNISNNSHIFRFFFFFFFFLEYLILLFISKFLSMLINLWDLKK